MSKKTCRVPPFLSTASLYELALLRITWSLADDRDQLLLYTANNPQDICIFTSNNPRGIGKGEPPNAPSNPLVATG